MKALKRFFKKYHELLTIPAAILIFILSIPFLRWLDPTAAIFDAGVFQIIPVSTIQLVLFLAVAWAMLGIVFGRIRRYLQNEMKNDFEKITPWERQKLAYFIFFALAFLLAYMAKTVA